MMLKKTLKRIVQVIPFLFFIVAFFLIIQVIIALKNDQTPTLFGHSIFLVVSPSMEDTIMTGDIIFVDTTDTNYEVDDIITFYQPGDESIIITHRIVLIEVVDGVTLYTTQGDNNFESLDFEIQFTSDYIIGTFSSKSSILGNIYEFIYRGGIGLIYGTVIIAFVSIGLLEVINIVKEISKHKQAELEAEKQRLVEIEVAKIRSEIENEDNQI